MLNPYSIDINTVLNELKSNRKNGLENEDVFNRLNQYGENVLKEENKKSLLSKFIYQFKDMMIIILLIASMISLIIAVIEKEGYFEPFLILFIVVLNAVIGLLQEGKAEKAMDALINMSVQKARVIRDGKELIIDAKLLVPGDIIKLEAGDFVPADARIIESNSLKSEESALTGESEATEKNAKIIIEKDSSLGDRSNMVYSGCSITYGTSISIVTATGMNTEIGKIADLLNVENKKITPLQKKLEQLGKTIGIGAILICIVIFTIGILSGMDLLEIFMIAVALAVSAIPEGLPAIVTVVLAIGVQRMVKKNAIIRKLPAVETLGSTSVICSDKTGTLTQNRMTLIKTYVGESNLIEKISENNSEDVLKILKYATLCSEGSVEIDKKGDIFLLGDPTETSIIYAAYKNGIKKEDLIINFPREATLPFDSNRKMMTSVNKFDDKYMVIVKGGFDVVAEKCIDGNLEEGRKVNEEFSREALRVLAVAYKESDNNSWDLDSENLEKGLTFVGLLGMIDPPRPEAQEAVQICRGAGIKPVMITGDYILTASAIAKSIGILEEGDKAINGKEMANLSDDQLDEQIQNISVYARVSPEDKIRIIHAWQRKGAVVSMTGDGVNDAPALKAADIGCAMGITGTDVAKGASDMILTDDNFFTIVEAVKEGRGIYNNIKHTVGFLLGTNIGEVLVVLTAMVLWQVTPLIAVQLLWINLVTDSLPAIALGMEPVKNNVMTIMPKPKNESIFANGYGFRIFLQGIMFAVLTLTGFASVWYITGEIEAARTMAFLTLGISQIFHSFNMRSGESLFKTGFFTNKYLNGSAIISLALIGIVALIPPLAMTFGLAQIGITFYAYAILLSIVPIIVIEIFKNIFQIKN